MNFFNDNPAIKFQLSHPLMQKIVALKERNFADKDKYDYASRDFEDAVENYEKVLEIIGEVCGDIIAPNAESVDHEGPHIVNNEVVYAKGTQQNLDALVKAGLMGITLPRTYGGLNFSIIPYIMAADIVSRADAGFVNIWGLQDCAETINEFATEDQKSRFLPRICGGETAAMDLTEPDAGSDLQAVQLRAYEKDGKWYLNGVKRFITNGDGHVALVLARSEAGTNDGRGLSMFIYDRNHKAVIVRRLENKMGIKGSPTCELVFKNAPAKLVGNRRLGLIKYVMSLMNGARLGVGAQSVGIAEAAYREAVKYAHEREQFGKPIHNFAGVYEMLANMRAKTDAIRTLLYETARGIDIYKAIEDKAKYGSITPEEKQKLRQYQKLSDILTPMLKLFSSEYANQITYDAIQVHGGSGFMKDYAVERMYRDARILTIYEGTSQLQVVAAIRGVINGGYIELIKSYEAKESKPEFSTMKKVLCQMRERFEQALERANSFGSNSEFYDFNSRRLVEMCGYLIMGHLLVIDANKNSVFSNSAELMIRMGQSKVEEAASFIMNFEESAIAKYKIAGDCKTCAE